MSVERWRLAVVAAVATALLCGSLLPTGSASPPVVGGVSPFTVSHLVGYAALAGSLAAADTVGPRPRRLAGILAVTVAYGGAIEGLQTLVPGRTFSGGDIALNTVGAAAGVTGWVLVLRLRGFLSRGTRR